MKDRFSEAHQDIRSRANMSTNNVLPLILLWNYLQLSSAAISNQINEFAPKYHYADTARTFDGKLVITPHRHLIVTFKPNINEGRVGYKGVMSSGWMWLDLLIKAVRQP